MADDQIRQRAKRVSMASSEFVTGDFDELVARAASEKTDVRSIAASRLMGLDDPRAIPVLIGLMADPSPRVRAQAALGLSHYEAAEARDVLVDHLQSDTEGLVRAQCAHALGNIGGAYREIVDSLGDSDWHVRVSALAALERHGDIAATPCIEPSSAMIGGR